MKKIFLLLVLLSISFSWAYSAVAESKTTQKKDRMAVIDIISRVKAETIDTETFTETLQSELLDQRKFDIVERAQLNRIIEEQKLNLSGVTDSDLKNIGRLAEASRIVTGSITKLDGRYILTVKMIDTATGVILAMGQKDAYTLSELNRNIKPLAQIIINRYTTARDGDDNTDELMERVKNNRDAAAESRSSHSSSSTASQAAVTEPVTPSAPAVNPNRRPKGYFPLMLGFVDYLQLPGPEYATTVSVYAITGDNYAVYGTQMAGFLGRADFLTGVQVAGIGTIANDVYGVQASPFFNLTSGTMGGIQAGMINTANKAYGVQAGLVNIAEDMVGVQVGLINVATRFKGVQIGFINTVATGFMPVMVGLNVNF